jgi:methylmalonyl-CoA/ethylmalonyl-CoA epimerase
MLKRIDHVGIVVADLGEAKRFVSEVLQLPLDRENDATGVLGVRTAFFRCGNADVELIEPVDPDERRKRLGGDVRARVEHIAFEVDELPSVLGTLQGLGVRMTTDEPVPVGDRLNAFTRPETTEDVVYQFFQFASPK